MRLQPGMVLFAEGDASSRVLLFVGGRVKVSTFSAEARRPSLGIGVPATFLGELSALDGQPHLATVTVVKRADYTAAARARSNSASPRRAGERYGRLDDGEIVIDLPMSQRELAGRVGSSREAVYRVLAQIADRGLVRADHRCLAVLDLEGLRLLSG